jgi:hypothetical protein
MSVDTAFQRLRDANPVPEPALLRTQSHDSAVLLAATRQRSTVMQTQEETINQKGQESPSRRLLIGLGVAAAVLLAVAVTVGVALALTTANPLPPANQVNDPDAAEAVAVVEAAYAAYNAGETEAWLAAVWPQGFESNELVGFGEVYAASVAAGARVHTIDCVPHGFGDWLIGENGAAVAGQRVRCATEETNNFHIPAGLEATFVSAWVVADGIIIAFEAEDDFGESEAFNLEFRNWLARNHKEAALGYNTFPWMFPKADSVPTALEYVDEFVQSSPDWPRN